VFGLLWVRRKFLRSRISQRRKSDEAGYTLMELLVVLAILGLLAAVATPMVLHYLDSAKVSTAKTEVSNLSAGLDESTWVLSSYLVANAVILPISARPRRQGRSA